MVRRARATVNRAVRSAEAGWRPGWDFVGTIEETAPEGGGPVVINFLLLSEYVKASALYVAVL